MTVARIYHTCRRCTHEVCFAARHTEQDQVSTAEGVTQKGSVTFPRATRILLYFRTARTDAHQEQLTPGHEKDEVNAMPLVH